MFLETVLFDLDGTVIDTGPLIADSFRHAVRKVLGKTIDDRDMLAYVGGWSLREQMCRLAPDRSQELVEAYRAYNEPRHAGLEFCSGMQELLLALRAEGVRLGLATAKRRSTVEIAFRYLPQLRGLFDTIVSAEDTERHKPNPDPLLLALERLGAHVGGAAYVGDSPFDVEAARTAGLRAIAVTWGGIHGEERLRAALPDVLVSSAEELRSALDVSPA
ncbi:MAG: HAD-IA family hydrolase [Gaiellaceae bacterium]|jgi:pyrophosphatase PpaX